MGALGHHLEGPDHRFRALYRGHFGFVWSLTAHFGVPAGAREDVAQEVWLTVHRRIDALRPEASARAWVAAIARHVASRHHRAQSRRARKHEALSLISDRAAEGNAEPDALALVEDALARMDPGQREVFLLTQVEQLSGPEVAQALELPLNTVYSRLRLARARLAEAIGAHDPDLSPLRSAPPPAKLANRVWLLLGLDVGRRGGAFATLASTWSAKLAVAAASAVATVAATAALSGRGDSPAHARDPIAVIERAALVAPPRGEAVSAVAMPPAPRIEAPAPVATPVATAAAPELARPAAKRERSAPASRRRAWARVPRTRRRRARARRCAHGRDCRGCDRGHRRQHAGGRSDVAASRRRGVARARRRQGPRTARATRGALPQRRARGRAPRGLGSHALRGRRCRGCARRCGVAGRRASRRRSGGRGAGRVRAALMRLRTQA
ncbi:MAG: sigma-70 family RNA polymerase sigma factor [Nannocystaceae bacterium]